jgi:hypothetical protein
MRRGAASHEASMTTLKKWNFTIDPPSPKLRRTRYAHV